MNGAELSGGFTTLDWVVVIGVLLGTTVVAGRVAGRQESMRDFFLGARSLPWWAVAASIIATEISAVTYISLPSVVQREGGNITYLQIGLFGSLLARAFVGYVLVPAYYEREIYSPYDYVGNRLGSQARALTTGLFTLGGILAQSARVYLTAVVLQVLLAKELAWVEAAIGLPPLVTSVAAIGVVAVGWTLMGGMATVIWTDAILFLLFLVGIAVTLFTLHGVLDGGLFAAIREGYSAGKLDLIDTSTDPTRPYTIWVALFVASWGQIGPYGCDHLMTQRLFCCKDARDARRAILASIAAMLVIFLVMLIGVGLWAYYREHPMGEAAEAMVSAKADRVFPVFITEVVGPGFKGLVIAGAFAAAISSLDSIMAALSQTTLSAVFLPRRKRFLEARGLSAESPEETRRTLRLSRWLVLGWGLVLCAAAVGVDQVAERYASILDLALAMAGYTGGALLAAFFLAFLPLRPRTQGLLWSAPLSVMTVFAVVWHADWAQYACWVYSGLALVLWFRKSRPLHGGVALVLALAGLYVLCAHGTFEGGKVLAWPYYVPIGSLVAFLFAFPLDQASSPESRSSTV